MTEFKHDISPLKRLRLWRKGYVYLEHRTRPGWSGSLPFFLVKCAKHGLFEDYPHGHDDHFSCPECFQEISESINPGRIKPKACDELRRKLG